ncbi:hypothetical protein A3C91_02860 [Candidatus Azambacteria bacterium RIFCSPHIGHO2_02_FULL_52_12]|uniref:Large ribosomal subunit protein bL25 n=1 Tax=Candidatus Azambacteria bacterium RIFCSPLOWO2_01_FULL_46_25 TaxID=1797298 RepID=A0A1F5BTC8_9BACT|nr:MAG: hypothetical protein A3C91_02860 [Candidatus Azambacteria bacterium RIFCSPHIGHO2_02_FULL_52_12]OGD33886.1 MAG: hypothetical protein A2988_00105 [Candidatus Azambacteria bacterium RIFCSPLOWO2_01_FULL_46_25]OGD36787.1 MAG: hypothetical protein A2850_02315 [Candidatus Azambacteria bacterium RIFCSPHIGHO2_01_FULL_51_74]
MAHLKAKPRDVEKDSIKRMRKTGSVPAVLYGHKVKNLHLTLDGSLFQKLYKTAGRTTVVGLALEGEKEDRNVLIHEVAVDPVWSFVTHVDLYQVNAKEKIKTEVPLVFIGESNAVKSEGGVLVKNIHHVEVEAFFKDLPHEIKVDISKLATFADSITVADLDIAPEVKIHADPKEVIAKVAPPRTETELASLKEEVVIKVDEVKVEGEEKKKERETAQALEEKTEK